MPTPTPSSGLVCAPAPGQDPHTEQTRTRILDVALETFASCGFRASSVREICRKAGVNSAAAHYHFGDKAALYRAVFEREVTRLPLHNLPFQGPGTPLEKLRAYYRGMLHGACSTGSGRLFMALQAREEFEPTGLLTDFWGKSLAPLHEHVRQFVAQETGWPDGSPEAETLTYSLAGMAAIYLHARPVVDALSPGMLAGPGQVDHLIEMLTGHALALLNAARNESTPW